MKENNFKFRTSFAEVVKAMDDKQAGQYIKAVCDYAFNGQVYSGKDTAIKSAFSLTKVVLDTDKFYREKGRLGAEILSKKKKSEERGTPFLARVVASGEGAEGMVKTLMEMLDAPTVNESKTTGKTVAKQG